MLEGTREQARGHARGAHLAAELRLARVRAGLTQRTVDELCGLRRGYVASAETGRIRPDEALVRRVVRTMEQSADRPVARTIGEKLRRARTEAGASRKALAEKSGVGLETIQEIETGVTHRPKPETLGKLFGAIGREVPGWEPAAEAPRPGRTAGERVGLRLAFARAEDATSLAALGRRVGLKAHNLHALEADAHGVTPEVMSRLTDALGGYGFPAADPAESARRLGASLGRRRRALGLSVRGLAGLVGAHPGDVRLAEEGRRGPSRKLAGLLGRMNRRLREEEDLTPPTSPACGEGKAEGTTEGTTAVGERVRAARLKAGLSPAALAERAGLRREALLWVEDGTRRPRQETLRALSGALGPGEGLDLLRAPTDVPAAGSLPRGGDAELARAVREARLAKGFSVAGLSEAAGVCEATVRAIEAARRSRPLPRTLRMLERALGRRLPRAASGRLRDGLRAARERAGLGRQEVADRAGVSYAVVHGLERGRTVRPDKASLRKLEAVLGPHGFDAGLEATYGRVGMALWEARKKAGLSIEELARAVGCERNKVLAAETYGRLDGAFLRNAARALEEAGIGSFADLLRSEGIVDGPSSS